ncbi:MAG: TlpA disulfide reductase family protein [Pseudomonadota bacterium]
MRLIAAVLFSALLYAGFVPGANPVSAAELTAEERASLDDLRVGDMTKLVIHDEARPPITEVFRDKHGNAISLSDFEGKVVVLNFWATWCPPCRAEMPSIDRLSGALGGDDLAVIALSTDRFDVGRVIAFFEEIEVQHLTVYQDRRGGVARMAGALGLPITVVLDREGREIARVTGEAEWDSPEAKAFLRRVMELTVPSA